MYVVTNRQIIDDASGLARFGHKPNPAGPNELRLLEVTRARGRWRVQVLDDELDAAEKLRLGLDEGETHYRSRLVAHEVVERARRRKRHVLLFVHGFNNDVAAVLDRAEGLERRYPVDVIAFTWPADGGGVRGVLNYRDDKRDARASAGALERALVRMQELLVELTQHERAACWEEASAAHTDDHERRDALYAKLLEKRCPFTVNLLAHSMGNYVLKQSLKSSLSGAGRLLFDNVALVAADTNVDGHAEWVDRIQCRGRILVCINEKDHALAASRLKSGEEQRARLGHSLHGLYARSATYVDFTTASWVGSSHAYFEGDPADRNAGVAGFFRAAFSGARAEARLRYNAARNTYEVR